MNTTDASTFEDVISETERLYLRRINPLNDDDCDFVVRLVNTPEWTANIASMPHVSSREGGRDYIVSRHMKLYEECGFGGFIMIRKQDGEKIGMCGLFRRPELAPYDDLGFAILTEFSRQGFMMEACVAVIEWARKVLGKTELRAVTKKTNAPSRCLLEKLGFAEVNPEENRVWWGSPQCVYSKSLVS